MNVNNYSEHRPCSAQPAAQRTLLHPASAAAPSPCSPARPLVGTPTNSRAACGDKRLFQAGAEEMGTTTSLRFGTLRSSRFFYLAGLARRFLRHAGADLPPCCAMMARAHEQAALFSSPFLPLSCCSTPTYRQRLWRAAEGFRVVFVGRSHFIERTNR